MQEIVTDPFRGRISVRANHPVFGMVELDEPQGKIKYAVINGETEGRIALLNLTKDGGLPLGQKVLIKKAKKGSEAFIALEIVAVAMSPFEQFSAEVELISQLYPRSRLARFLLWLDYRKRRWQNRPFSFPVVEDEGVPVGEPMDVYHLSLHDMMEHEVRGQLTAEVLLKGRRINAFSCEGYAQMEEMVGRTTVQPRWV